MSVEECMAERIAELGELLGTVISRIYAGIRDRTDVALQDIWTTAPYHVRAPGYLDTRLVRLDFADRRAAVSAHAIAVVAFFARIGNAIAAEWLDGDVEFPGALEYIVRIHRFFLPELPPMSTSRETHGKCTESSSHSWGKIERAGQSPGPYCTEPSQLPGAPSVVV